MSNCHDLSERKKRYVRPCIPCSKMNNGCRRKHVMIDTCTWVAPFLLESRAERGNKLQEDIKTKKIRPYMSTDQVAHIVGIFTEEIRKIRDSKRYTEEGILLSNFRDCMHLILEEFQILDFEDGHSKIYDSLKESCRMHSHDLRNVAVAISNNIHNFETDDRALIGDKDSIKKVSKDLKGYNIKINGK